MANPKRKITRLASLHRKWLNDVGQDVYDYSRNRVAVGLADASIRSCLDISSNLRGIAIYLGTGGEEKGSAVIKYSTIFAYHQF